MYSYRNRDLVVVSEVEVDHNPADPEHLRPKIIARHLNTIERICVDADGNKQGRYVLEVNGFVTIEGFFLDNKKDGVWHYYTHPKDDCAHALTIRHYKDGKLIRTRKKNIDGMLLYEKVVIDEDSVSGAPGPHRLREFTDKGVLQYNSYPTQDKWCEETYYPNGQLRTKIHFKCYAAFRSYRNETCAYSADDYSNYTEYPTIDRYDGAYKTWYENNQPKEVLYFRDGIQVGEATHYYEDGKLLYHGRYSDGKRDGHWEVCITNEDGTSEIVEVVYDKGELKGRWTEVTTMGIKKDEAVEEAVKEAIKGGKK